MSRITALLVALFISFGAVAQTTTPSNTAVPNDIVGTYTGSHTWGTSMKLVIISVDEKGLISGKLTTFQRNCSGDFTATGQVQGNIIEINTPARDASWEKCVPKKFILTKNGNLLDGRMEAPGYQTLPISFSR